MGRRRFAVVLEIPAPHAAEIDVLRRALGVADVARIAPHITIVPPVNVSDDALDDALDLLHTAAVDTAPIPASVGPVASFWPRSAVLFLGVGDDDAVTAMGELRARLFHPPFSRPEGRRFVPHVTLRNRMPEGRLPAAVEVLPGYELDLTFDRLHLIEELTTDHGRVWRPVHEVPFGEAAIVGRGGLPIEITCTAGIPLDAQGLIRRASADGASGHSRLARGRWDPVGEPVVLTARRPGESPGGDDGVPGGRARVLAVLAGWHAADLVVVDDVLVEPESRREGIGRHLLAWAESEAAERGASRLVATVPDDPAIRQLFTQAGWTTEGLAGGLGGPELRRMARALRAEP